MYEVTIYQNWAQNKSGRSQAGVVRVDGDVISALDNAKSALSKLPKEDRAEVHSLKIDPVEESEAGGINIRRPDENKNSED